jgi:hypothetical protein
MIIIIPYRSLLLQTTVAILLLWLLAQSHCLSSTRADTTKNPTAADIEKLALQARQNLKTLYVKLRYDCQDFHPKPARRTGTRILWMDGEKLRQDRLFDQGGPLHPGARRVLCHHCEKPHHDLIWYETPPGDPPLRAILDEIPPGQQRQFRGDAIDPRLLGYACLPSETLYPSQIPLNYIFGNHPTLRRQSVEMQVSEWNGLRCFLLHSTFPEQCEQKVWVAPERGYNVVRILWTSPRQTEEIQVELQPVGTTGLWFPKKIFYQCHHDGQLESQETVQILDVQLNQPIPPSTFTLAGCLPEGTHIAIRTGEQVTYGEIKNGKFVPQPPLTFAAAKELLASNPSPPQPLQPQRQWDPWLVTAVVLLTLTNFGVLLLWRRSASSSSRNPS